MTVLFMGLTETTSLLLLRAKRKKITRSSQQIEIFTGRNHGLENICDQNIEPPIGFGVAIGVAVKQSIPAPPLLVDEQPSKGTRPEIVVANKVLIGDDQRNGFVD